MSLLAERQIVGEAGRLKLELDGGRVDDFAEVEMVDGSAAVEVVDDFEVAEKMAKRTREICCYFEQLDLVKGS